MTITVKQKADFVVPARVRPQVGIKAGDQREFKVAGTIIPKLPNADDEYTREQRRTVDARLAKADEDIEQGRVYGPFDTAEEMAASIEANIGIQRSAKRKAKPAR